MSKPSTLPRWADTVTSDSSRVVAPPSGKLDVGVASGEQIAAQHFNWLLNLIYQWVAYLNGLAAEAFTWTAVHVFSSPIYINAGVASAVILNQTLTVIGTTLLHTLGVSGSVSITGAVTVDGSLEVTTGNLKAQDIRYTTLRKRQFATGGGHNANIGVGIQSVTTLQGAANNPNTAGTPMFWDVPVVTETGETITAKVRVKQSVGVIGGIVVSLCYTDSTNTAQTVISVNSTATTSIEQLTVATGHVVAADRMYFIRFAGDAGTTAQSRDYIHAWLEVTRP